MPRRYWVQDSDDLIIGGTDFDSEAAPADTTAVAESVIRMADPPGANGLILAGGTWDGAAYTPPDGLSTAASRMIADLHDAHLRYLTTGRKNWWVGLRHGDPMPQGPLDATDIWEYSQMGLGYRIAQGDWPTGANALTDAEKRDRVDHIINVLDTLTKTWYLAQIDPSSQGLTQPGGMWAGANLADGQVIYSDVIAANGDRMTIDGTFNARGTTFPVNFDPDAVGLIGS